MAAGRLPQMWRVPFSLRRMSNCDVGSNGSGLPCNIVAEHGIEGCDHFSHDGDDNYFGFLVGRSETTMEELEGGIVSTSAQRRHVEHVTDGQPAPVDAAMSFEPAAIEVVGRKADEGRDLLAAHAAELRQQRD